MTVREAQKQGLPEVVYKEGGCTHGVRILHLADKDRGYAVALCGRKRDSKLEPGATGEFCVVCLEEHRRRRGKDYA